MSKRISALASPTVSKIKSTSSSRQQSRTQSRTGFAEDDTGAELINEISFGNLDELLSERLKEVLSLHECQQQHSSEDIETGLPNVYDLSNSTSNNKKKDITRIHSIPLILATITNKDITTDERKILLQKLYDLVILRPSLEEEYQDEYDYEMDLLKLLKIFQTAKDQDELLLAIRALCVFIVTNIDYSTVVFSTDKSINCFSLLEKKISDQSVSDDVMPQLIYAYTSLLLCLHDESGGFGLEDNLEFLVSQLEACAATPLDSQTVLNALVYGIGSTLTLMVSNSKSNEFVENILEVVADILTDIDVLEVIKPIAMLFGLGYELYDYDDENLDPEDDYTPLPYLNTFSIISRLTNLVKSSTKKVSKKDKKEGRSVFRDVLKTIEVYSNLQRRQNYLNPSPEDFESREDLTLSHLKLSKSRSLAVNSWFAFFRLIQLKWLFTSGLHTQLANSSRIKSTIRDKPSNSYASQFTNNANDASNESYDWKNENVKREQGKKLQIKLEKERMAKLNNVIEQQGINTGH
ncbi:hypothetical protein WICPIJ_001438 [Wickerhamomyces pijperi]|uniref:Interferon-related developmental regulator N-terminal domain-containing protein n=1 Tax=Wickerhamomyces pijperi TaxID=599730 RepID=A0A9P8QBL1_WICPI|nr:hypothetical protein WICPIJ_001438 [Wickerhamomyces pijperi]